MEVSPDWLEGGHHHLQEKDQSSDIFISREQGQHFRGSNAGSQDFEVVINEGPLVC